MECSWEAKDVLKGGCTAEHDTCLATHVFRALTHDWKLIWFRVMQHLPISMFRTISISQDYWGLTAGRLRCLERTSEARDALTGSSRYHTCLTTQVFEAWMHACKLTCNMCNAYRSRLSKCHAYQYITPVNVGFKALLLTCRQATLIGACFKGHRCTDR